ncbi:MAG TPA: ABC transporter permease subunit [Candidatus Limnocylindrales bacterium]|nr:ABC transporter permease subunit [Candidatus Limnocylindrales bacterium]
MKALLRADWLRLRRRRDLWIIAIAVLVIGGISFLTGYRSDVLDPVLQTEAQIRQEIIENSEFGGMTQAEIDAMIDQWVVERMQSDAEQARLWEEYQAITLQKYDLGQSIFTVIGDGVAPLLALILISTLAVGDEFRYGTVRTSLLAAGHRRRFLAARLITLGAATAALFAALAVLATLLSLILRLIGAEVAPTTVPIDPAASAAWLAGLILVTLVLVALGVALTVLLRSGALPLLLILVASLVDLFVASLEVFRFPAFLSGVPQAFPGTAIRGLTMRLGIDTHAVALAADGSPPPFELPLAVVAGIVVAWGLIFLVVADRRFGTMDVVE